LGTEKWEGKYFFAPNFISKTIPPPRPFNIISREKISGGQINI